MALVVFSPSNMQTWMQCPLKFWGQQSKLLVWRDSPAKARGTAVHEAMQTALEKGPGAVTEWPSGMDWAYTQDTLRKLRVVIEGHSESGGLELHTEHEMCVNDKLKATDWWGEDAYLRAKADFLLLRPGMHAHIGDWKTGKIYPGMDFQLRVEALLAHVLYAVPVVTWGLYYLDQGQTKTGTVDFRDGIAPVKDVLQTMRTMLNACSAGSYPPKRNRFCRWCDWYHTEHCLASREW